MKCIKWQSNVPHRASHNLARCSCFCMTYCPSVTRQQHDNRDLQLFKIVISSIWQSSKMVWYKCQLMLYLLFIFRLEWCSDCIHDTGSLVPSSCLHLCYCGSMSKRTSISLILGRRNLPCCRWVFNHTCNKYISKCKIQFRWQ